MPDRATMVTLHSATQVITGKIITHNSHTWTHVNINKTNGGIMIALKIVIIMILRIITRPTGPGTITMDRINSGLLIALYFSAMTFISFNLMSSRFTDNNNSKTKDFIICTFNCNGFKGSYGYIQNFLNSMMWSS